MCPLVAREEAPGPKPFPNICIIQQSKTHGHGSRRALGLRPQSITYRFPNIGLTKQGNTHVLICSPFALVMSALVMIVVYPYYLTNSFSVWSTFSWNCRCGSIRSVYIPLLLNTCSALPPGFFIHLFILHDFMILLFIDICSQLISNGNTNRANDTTCAPFMSVPNFQRVRCVVAVSIKPQKTSSSSL